MIERLTQDLVCVFVSDGRVEFSAVGSWEEYLLLRSISEHEDDRVTVGAYVLREVFARSRIAC
jgi:hypothetical protein